MRAVALLFAIPAILMVVLVGSTITSLFSGLV